MSETNEDQLAAKVEVQMATIGLDETATTIGSVSTPTPAPELEQAEVTPVSEPAAESTPEKEATLAATPTEETPAAEITPVKEPSGVPDAFRRAAMNLTWKPDEIDEFWAKDPEGALKTFEKMYEAVNTSSQQFAKLGQAQKIAQEVPVTPAVALTPAPAAGIDLSKLEEEYAGDPLLDVVKQLVAKADARTQVQPVSTPDSAIPQTVDYNPAMGQEIHNFFATPGLAEANFYGMGLERQDLTQRQQSRRMDVLTQADFIRDGAAASGVEMSNQEAMSRAHNDVAHEEITASVRQTITATLKKRAANIDFVPTAAVTASAEGDKSEKGKMQKVIDKASAGLKKLYG